MILVRVRLPRPLIFQVLDSKKMVVVVAGSDTLCLANSSKSRLPAGGSQPSKIGLTSRFHAYEQNLKIQT